MATTTTLTIRAGGMETDIPGSQLPDREPCLFLTQDYVEGWHGTPQIKLNLTELAMGDGAAAPQDGAILYAARTCTAHVIATGRTRSDVLAQAQRVNRFAHRLCTVELADADDDTIAIGCCVSMEWDSERHPTHMAGTVTIVCPDPRRYGTDTLSATLVPGGNSDGGLDLTDARLAWPLAWGESAASHSVATLHNAGTAAAYPTISIRGDISDVTIAEPATGRELSISGYIGWNPIILDCLSRTASIGGVDVTRRLGRRDFPSIAPGGDTTLALMCSGTNGSVSIEWHDTYI